VAQTISSLIRHSSSTPDLTGTSASRHDSGPTRTEAQLLLEAYETMTANIKSDTGGLEPMALARQAAAEAQADAMMSYLEPEYVAMDNVLTELVKQVGQGCKERGDLLEACRRKFIDTFSTSALCLHHLTRQVEDLRQMNAAERALRSNRGTEEERDLAVQRLAAMELEVTWCSRTHVFVGMHSIEA